MKAKQKVLWQFSVSFNRFECNGEELQSLEKTKPDYIEVLGALTDVIAEVKERTGVPILAGGFIRTVDDVESFKCWCDSNYDIKTRTMETLPKSDENVK